MTEPLSDSEYRQAQCRLLGVNVVSLTAQTLGCVACGAVLRSDQGLPSRAAYGFREMADAAFNLGWRFKESEKLRVVGPLCPACAAKPDQERETP